MRPVTATVGLLFIAFCHSSFAQNAAPDGGDVELAVAEGAPLTVECALRVEERAEWRRDGAPPPADMRAAEAAGAGGLTARLHAAAARAHHAGRYTCSRAPRARAVRVRVLPAPARARARAGADVTSAAPAASAAPADDGGEWLEHAYNLTQPLQLNCTAGAAADTSGAVITWSVNGTSLDESALRGRYKLAGGGARLLVERALEDDYGNYSCAADGAPALRWRVRAHAVLRLPSDSNVVEGQKLKLTCRVIGKPYPPVRWVYRADAEQENGTDALALLGERGAAAASAAGVPGGELVLAAAARADAGVYSCEADGAEARTVLRVKDMYAALWPFLGICAEVFVLCAIILVYERRRTKPECEDSDTDNHDQKKS